MYVYEYARSSCSACSVCVRVCVCVAYAVSHDLRDLPAHDTFSTALSPA